MTFRYDVVPLSPGESQTTLAWEELAEESGASPFLRHSWIRDWGEAFGGKLELHCLWRGTELVAALPLLRHATLLSSPTNWHSVESGWMSRDEQATAQLVQCLLHGGMVVSLGHLRGDQPSTFASMSVDANCRVVSWVQQRSPWIRIEGDWGDYAASLDQRWLRQLARRQSKLEATGMLTLEVSDGHDALPALLDEGFQLEAAGWKGAAGSSVLASRATRSFYYGVARWASERNWLRLGFLRINGRAIAFDYAIEHGGTHYFLKTGFDPALREFAPGLLLRQAMIKRSFEDGMSAYALLGADEPWKLRWSNSINNAVRVMSFPSSFAGFTQYPLYQYLRPIAKRAQRHVQRIRSG